MKLFKIIRAHHWWHSVLSFLFGVSYLFVFYFKWSFEECLGVLPVVMFLVISTAVTGYLINNLTDADEDRASGKNVALPPRVGWWVMAMIAMLALSVWMILITQKAMSGVIFFALQYVCFVLYSVKPFRLKRTLVASVVLDALYNSTLFVLLILSLFTDVFSLSIVFSVILFVWLLTRGIKNYIIHLSHDRKYDRRAGRKTLVHRMGNRRTQWVLNGLLLIETLLFVPVLLLFGNIIMYVLLVFVFIYSLQYVIYPVYKKQSKRVPLLMRYVLNDFYENILPLTALILLSVNDVRFVWIALIHLVLFPNVFIRIGETGRFWGSHLKTIIKK